MSRSRKDASLRREEILEATVAQIQVRGIPALRIADVGQALSVSPALVVYHFGTKESLIAEAFAWAAQRDIDRLDKLTAGLPTALQRLRTALHWYAPTEEGVGWTLWIEGWAGALRDATLQEVGQQLDLRWKEALTAIIQDGVTDGEFHTADPRGAAWRITALLDGLAVQMIVHRRTQEPGLVGRWSRQVIARELGVDEESLAAE